MRRVLLVSALALIALVMGCGSSSGGGGTELSPTFGPAPWNEGDKLSYDILDKSGNSIGTSEYSFARDGDAWLIVISDQAGGMSQSAKVRIDAGTLKPLGEEKSIKTADVDASLRTTYGEGKLQVDAVQNGQNKSASTDVPADAIENDQLLMTLRALPLADGYQARFVTVVGQSVAKVDTTVKVTDREKVDTPAGSFDAWKVELDFGQIKQQAWYQVDAPHNLVQYDNGTTKTVLHSK